jgi:hypothetical protein
VSAPDVKALELAARRTSWAHEAAEGPAKVKIAAELAVLRARIAEIVAAQRASVARPVPAPAPVTRLVLFNPHVRPHMRMTLTVTGVGMADASASHPNVRSYRGRCVAAPDGRYHWPMKMGDVEQCLEDSYSDGEWLWQRNDRDAELFLRAMRDGAAGPDMLAGSDGCDEPGLEPERADVPCMPVPTPETVGGLRRGDVPAEGWLVVEDGDPVRATDPRGRLWLLSYDSGSTGNVMRRGAYARGWTARHSWEPTDAHEGGCLEREALTLSDLLARCARAEVRLVAHVVRGAA